MARILTVGETMALVTAERNGNLRSGDLLRTSIGGAESNVAIGARRLGIEARWAGRIGSDSFGEMVVAALRAEDIELHHIVDPTRPTGHMLKQRRTPQTQQITFFRDRSAGSALSSADLPDRILDDVDLLHVTGIPSAVSESAGEAVTDLAQRARSRGIRVSLDVNYRPSLWRGRDLREQLVCLAQQANIMFAGELEAGLLVPTDDAPTMAAALVTRFNLDEAVITLGAMGSLAMANGAVWHQDAVPVHVVDSVGAGDAFVAGYLSASLRDQPPAQRLLTGAQCGAFACLSEGDWEGSPTRTELGLLTSPEETSR